MVRRDSLVNENFRDYFKGKKTVIYKQNKYGFVCLFVCFVALRPKPTAMVIAGRSVHLTTLFPGQA